MQDFYKFLLDKLLPGKTTMNIVDVFAAWEESHPFSEEDGSRTKKLRYCLDALKNEGLIDLQNDGKESVGKIPFPGKIRFLQSSKKECRDYSWAKSYDWHPDLARFAPFPSSVLDDARVIDEWLKKNEIHEEVPLCERSYEIFGNEKYLSRKWKKGLFGKIMAPLSIIGAYWPPVPLAYAKPCVPSQGESMLLLENQHSYASFCRWNDRVGRWVAVAFGKGGAVEGMPESIRSAAQESGASQVEYFGDIDPAGINILGDLADRCQYPKISPLKEAYSWLLKNAVGNDGSPVVFGDKEARILKHMMPELMAGIIAIWKRGKRIPQEALGFRHLSAGVLS